MLPHVIRPISICNIQYSYSEYLMVCAVFSEVNREAFPWNPQAGFDLLHLIGIKKLRILINDVTKDEKKPTAMSGFKSISL